MILYTLIKGGADNENLLPDGRNDTRTQRSTYRGGAHPKNKKRNYELKIVHSTCKTNTDLFGNTSPFSYIKLISQQFTFFFLYYFYTSKTFLLVGNTNFLSLCLTGAQLGDLCSKRALFEFAYGKKKRGNPHVRRWGDCDANLGIHGILGEQASKPHRRFDLDCERICGINCHSPTKHNSSWEWQSNWSYKMLLLPPIFCLTPTLTFRALPGNLWSWLSVCNFYPTIWNIIIKLASPPYPPRIKSTDILLM